MSEQKKYVTFRDLKELNPPQSSSIAPAKAQSTKTKKITTSTPSISSISSSPSTSRIPSTSSKAKTVSDKKSFKPQAERDIPQIESIAPERDFQRVPNSVTRQIMASGVFKGKSKQVWDYLWSVSRGAINPVRIIKRSRKDIKNGSGIGSMVTVDAAITHLESIGLLRVLPSVGSLAGNSYEIFTPEEIAISYTSTSSTPSITSPTQKLDNLDILESSISSITLSSLKSEVSGHPNTLYNTCIDDDIYTHTVEKEFARIILVCAEKILGEKIPINPQEVSRWNECATLIATELENAAKNAKGISSVPAFLATHLRRSFAKNDSEFFDKGKPPVNLPVREKNDKPTDLESKGKSRFSLGECLRFAEYLGVKGKGIVNPGGYATTIFRSGEADELIEEFLKKSPEPLAPVKCPDCNDDDLRYISGRDGEKLKCEHPRLPLAIKLYEALEELLALHLGDASYQESDLLEDLKFKIEREGLKWDESLAMALALKEKNRYQVN
ncbi:MAG: hypothetical protein AB1757_13405 [Acidobacteriota bacterium]